MFSRESIESAQRCVRAAMPPTLQQRWPLLDQRVGAQVWVKHENHTPVGAFKLRGGLTYFAALREREPAVRGVISATRGNHGQSVGFAARRHGLAASGVTLESVCVGVRGVDALLPSTVQRTQDPTAPILSAVLATPNGPVVLNSPSLQD